MKIALSLVERGYVPKPLIRHGIRRLLAERLREQELVYAVLTSSHPERYAVCDSTGFTLAIEEIERIQVLDQAPPRWRARLE